MDLKILNKKRIIRSKRTRQKIKRGTAECPRLSVFRSGRHTYAQIINDEKGETLVSVSLKEIKEIEKKKVTKTEAAKEIGRLIAEKTKKAGIDKVVFDRGRYKYHGRVKAVAEGAREKGLNF